MERPLSKCEHHGQPHDSNAHGKSERHRPTQTTEWRVSESTKRRSSYEGRPKKSHAEPNVSRDHDYVRRWLAQTDLEMKSDANRPRTQGKEAEHRDTRRKPQLELRSFRQAFIESDNVQQQSKRKRRHRSSSDSSLLEPVLTLKPKSRKGAEPNLHDLERREESASHHHKKRKIAPSDSGSSANSNIRRENFERRDRHRTREDRYEPKEKHKSDKADVERKLKKRPEKKGGKRKESKKAGEDLMHHFSSKSIGQERLTIRPSHGPGLFKNGRTSSPVRRRGLPDLVFSEMEFLQHTSRHAAPKDAPRVTSKSRGKAKYRASREQDRISMFFKSTKSPLSETSPSARKERSPIYMSDERSVYIKHGAADRVQEHSQSIDLPEKRYTGLDQAGPFSKRFSASRGRTPSIQYLRTMPDTTSKLSENATTGVAWSETQISHGATAASTRQNHKYHASPIPEPVRRSIESTGIFRDTGIGGTPGLTSSRTRPTRPQDDLYHKQVSKDIQGNAKDLNHTTKQTSLKGTFTYKPTELTARRPRPATQDQNPRPRQNPKMEKGEASKELRSSNENQTTSREDSATRKSSEIVVEHLDPELGWQQQRDPSRLEKTKDAPSLDIPQYRELKSSPTTREEIAKHARVKRPAAALPATRAPEEPNIHGGSNTDVTVEQHVSEENTGSSHNANLTRAEKVRPPVPPKAPETSTDVSGALNSLDNARNTQSGSGTKLNLSKNTHDLSPDSYGQMQPQFRLQLNGVEGREPVVLTKRHYTRKLGSARLEPASLIGLPVRGLSRGSFTQLARIPHLPPVAGPEPLYCDQIQRQYVPEEPFFENGTEKYPPEEYLASLHPETALYLKNINYDILEDQKYLGDGYALGPRDGGPETYKYVTEDAINNPYPWQPRGQGGDFKEHLEKWDVRGQALSYDYEVVDNSYGKQAFMGEYGLEEHGIAYENQVTGEEILMQDFWRSHRPC